MPESIPFDALGLSQEELQERVVKTVADQLLTTTYADEEGYDFPRASEFAEKLQTLIRKHIDAKVQEIAEEHVLPKVSGMVDKMEFPHTNRYGEKLRDPQTIREFIVEKTDRWLTEKVDFEGKSADERRQWGGSFTAKGTRVAHMVHKHLHHRISTALTDAFGNLNKQVAEGLQETVKIQLAEVLKNLTLKLKTGR